MYINKLEIKALCLLCLSIGTIHISCKKLIGIDDPVDSITSKQVFTTDATATSAMAGVYSGLINGGNTSVFLNAGQLFSAGLTTSIAAISSDELYLYAGTRNGLYLYNTNHINVLNSGSSNLIWTSAYTTIYGANSVIEGIAASTSPTLHDNVRNELNAEAKFLRAFCYMYLVNFYGDVPMALTVDFNKTQNLPRMPKELVYQQIIKDLKDAQADLASDYSAGKGERIIPNKWAASLLLARAYLYTGDYGNAAVQATEVINNNALYGLEPDLNRVFSTTSREAIWQLKQTTENSTLKNATPEGYLFLPNPLSTGTAQYCLTDQLLSSFENGDQRRIAWVGSTDNTYSSGSTPAITYYPYKYKIGSGNGTDGQSALEYYMVLRVAEAYLIRAEAEANGTLGGSSSAITDLNIIRNRAGLPNLSSNVNTKAAVAKERQLEFFAEWGHRWFDLKRTGQAHSVLSVIPLKQPWAGDYQLLYPIPSAEIISDHFLIQNLGY